MCYLRAHGNVYFRLHYANNCFDENCFQSATLSAHTSLEIDKSSNSLPNNIFLSVIFQLSQYPNLKEVFKKSLTIHAASLQHL